MHYNCALRAYIHIAVNLVSLDNLYWFMNMKISYTGLHILMCQYRFWWVILGSFEVKLHVWSNK